MKKHDEGYVLPLVLVVMIVMCLIATSLMSFSLQNLKSQQASIDRMVEKYEVEGGVEIIVAKLQSATFDYIEESVIKNYIETAVPSNLKVMDCTFNIEDYCADFRIVHNDASEGSVSIRCKLKLVIEQKEVKTVNYELFEVMNTGGNAE